MNVIRNISVIILSAIFLASTSGILIFHARCICSGNEQVSVYVNPESCEDNLHIHHAHAENGEEVCTTENDCHECSSQNNDCRCEAPEVKYLKLESQVVNEKVRVEKIQPLQLKVLETIAVCLFNAEDDTENSGLNYIDPPPPFQTSAEFLIKIHKLKIPVLA